MYATLHKVDEISREQIRQWNQLLSNSSPIRSPYLSHAFCKAVQDLRGGVFVLIINDGGGVGYLPFQIRAGRQLLGHAEEVGGCQSNHFGIVGDLKGEIDAEKMLYAANLSSLRVEHAVPAMCPFEFRESEMRLGAMVHSTDYQGYVLQLRAREKGFLQNVERAKRQLARDVGELRFEWHASNPTKALEHLIDAKREQYRRTGASDDLAVTWRKRLLYRLLDEPKTSLCRAVVHTLHAGDEWLASEINLVCSDTMAIWYRVYNPNYGRYGPGHLMMFEVIRAGNSMGIQYFDLSDGGADYKAKFQSESYSFCKGALRRRTLLGYTEQVVQSLSWRFEKLVTQGQRLKSSSESKKNQSSR